MISSMLKTLSEEVPKVRNGFDKLQGEDPAADGS